MLDYYTDFGFKKLFGKEMEYEDSIIKSNKINASDTNHRKCDPLFAQCRLSHLANVIKKDGLEGENAPQEWS